MILAKNELKKIFIYINNDVMPVMFDVSLCFMTSIVLHTQRIYNRTVSSYVVVFIFVSFLAGLGQKSSATVHFALPRQPIN